MVYWQDAEHRGVMPRNANTAIKVATSAGAIFGQCIFGYLGDYLGRKKMYGIELMIIISTTLAQSLCGESTTLSIVGVLIFYRVVMGIGVGGDCKYKAESLSRLRLASGRVYAGSHIILHAVLLTDSQIH
jgi:PHS family inorganic phosphate transporter-like MFS transporter